MFTFYVTKSENQIIFMNSNMTGISFK